jgi:hypothetical protein
MRATVSEGAGAGLACYCKHCRAYAHHLSMSEILDEAGGCTLYQTTPEHVHVTEGASHMACLQMTPQGPFRWYAGCCGTPFANTASRMGVPFVGVLTAFAKTEAALPPIAARVHGDGATGPLPGRKGSTAGAVFGILKRAVGARLRGAHTQTPFFEPSGAPVAKPHVLSHEERARAYSA